MCCPWLTVGTGVLRALAGGLETDASPAGPGPNPHLQGSFPLGFATCSDACPWAALGLPDPQSGRRRKDLNNPGGTKAAGPAAPSW